MAVLRWIGLGLGFLLASLFGSMIGMVIGSGWTSDHLADKGGCQTMTVSVLGLIAGICTKAVLSWNSWRIIALIGGISTAIGIVLAFGSGREIRKLQAKGDVAGLLKSLAHSSSQRRKQSARALVKMYHSGRLDEKHKKLILAQRAAIIEQHRDSTGHTDQTHDDKMCYLGGAPKHTDRMIKGGSGEHSDHSGHSDAGIGVEFVL